MAAAMPSATASSSASPAAGAVNQPNFSTPMGMLSSQPSRTTQQPAAPESSDAA